MTTTAKTAIITGGASGFGLETAKSLLSDGWIVHIFDLNAKAGEAVIREHTGLEFRQVDVTSWDSLSSAFKAVFSSRGRLDLVFANAGVLPQEDFYAIDDAVPPVEPRHTCININLKAVANTCQLTRYYLRTSKQLGQDRVLVMTASIGGFYAQEFSPLYTASKAGVVAFMRCVAPTFYEDGIRTYAICPGPVRTNLLSKSAWDAFPQEFMTPVEAIVSTVQTLIRGGKLQDAKGREVAESENYGLAVEILGNEIFIRDQMEFANDAVRQLCDGAKRQNQQANMSGGH